MQLLLCVVYISLNMWATFFGVRVCGFEKMTLYSLWWFIRGESYVWGVLDAMEAGFSILTGSNSIWLKHLYMNQGSRSLLKKTYPKFDNPGHFLRADDLRNNNIFYLSRNWWNK